MVKRFLKGTLCAALSLSMALGGVMVGASQDQSVKVQASKDRVQTTVQSTAAPLKKVEKKQSKVKDARNVQTVTTTVADTISRYNSFMANGNAQTGIEGTVGTAGLIPVGIVRVSRTGTVIVKYYCYTTSPYGSQYEQTLKLIHTNGAEISGVTMSRTGTGNKRQLWATNVPAGTYYIATSYTISADTSIKAGFSSAVVPNANGRYLNSSGILVGGNRGTSYQYFKMSKRGVAKLALQRYAYYGGPYGMEYTVQRRSGRSWKTVQSRKYSSSNSWGYVGLSAGTYRLVLKSPDSNVLALRFRASTANSSYGTKKKKAKTIKRKKYKKQTFTPTDSTKKAHWYKIKVSKKRSTYIDVTSLGNEGSIWAQVSGRMRLKSKKIKNGIRFYGKAKAGTYYIKVYKLSKSTTGSYQIKYKK